VESFAQCGSEESSASNSTKSGTTSTEAASRRRERRSGPPRPPRQDRYFAARNDSSECGAEGYVNLRAAIVRALEAFEDGDELEAAAILRSAISTFDGSPIGPPLACPKCGLDCRWPGLLDHHLRFVHGDSLEQEAAA
jgi:hypothetical protein